MNRPKRQVEITELDRAWPSSQKREGVVTSKLAITNSVHPNSSNKNKVHKILSRCMSKMITSLELYT